MDKQDCVLENDTYGILWDFEIQTDHQIPVRRPDLVISNNKSEELTVKWILPS